ncbi:stage III sporulation protein AE [Caloramator australicus]|uniref:Stage III sporulation protein AE n=1 Tax=Caloramator australicus RC3 TaxID=857293 RepID=I7KA59_9CLOT|nr:stage III sporulation protein AE [Caloramator australicus]CCJ34597.1 Stage III sporulation protein AE [Caloramator australicus RC3]
MKIMLKTSALIFLFLFFINIYVFSMNKDPTYTDFSSLEKVSKSLQQTYEYFPELSLKKILDDYKSSGSLKLTFKDFTKNIIGFSIKEILINYKLLIELLVIGIISALMHNLQNSFDENSIAKIANFAIFLLITTIIIKSFTYAISIAAKAITDMVEFMNALIPSMISILIGTGSVATATTLDPIIMFFIKFSSDIIKNFVLPVTIIVVAVHIVDNLSDDIKIGKLGDFINTINTLVLGFLMTVFIAIITVRGITANTFDEVALKSTKFAVDKLIPIVGGALSDAVATVASYSLILKDALSVFGVVMIVGICVFPLIKIMVISLIYKFTCVVLEPIVDKKIVEGLNAASKSLTIVFAAVLSVAVMFFIMITILASAGKVIVNVG